MPGRAPQTDIHGDPLPEGVLARMGTTRLRHAMGEKGLTEIRFRFEPEGTKILIQ